MQLIPPIIVLSLVAYRITRFLLEDSLIDAQRWWVQKKIAGGVATHDATPKWRLKLLDLTECPYCASVWVSAAATGYAMIWWTAPQPVLTWLGTCAGCMIVWRVVEK